LGDLEKLVSAGISHIRIPYGYWLVDVAADEPFPAPPESDSQGQRFYLKRMLGWAESVGLKVLLDLHAAPGSQNGFDNSGQRDEAKFIGTKKIDRNEQSQFLVKSPDL
jgi:glucan 1,3-beta-glucosidase